MQQSSLAETVRAAVALLIRTSLKTNPLVPALVIGLGFAECGAQAAPPAVDAVSSGTAFKPASMTVSHTASGTNRLMLVGVSFDPQSNPTVASVTYNGQNLDFVGADQQAVEARMEIWKLVAPPTGPADVVVTFSKTLRAGAVVGIMTFTGVDQATPLGTFVANNGTNSTATVNVASATDELVFAVVDVEEAGPLTVGPGQTLHWNDAVPPKPYAGGSTEAGAATVTMSWSLSGADSWTIGGVSIKDFSAPAVNSRSIGTNAGVLYSTGNASITIATNTVTFGGGASLPSSIGAGDELAIGGDTFYILSRDSATQVTIQGNSSSTHTNIAYTIRRAYNTIHAWEAARNGDLVADNRREVGICYNDGPFVFASVLDIDGSTTDVLHYMSLTVAGGHRHNGTAGTGVVIDATGGLGGPVVWIRDSYTQVEWIEITSFDQRGILVSGGSQNNLFQNLLIHDAPPLFPVIENSGDGTVRNCILYDGWVGILITGVAQATIENVTVHNMSLYGVDMHGTATIAVKNSIAVGSGTTDFSLSGTISYFGNNMYSTTVDFTPGSYQGGNQPPPANLDDLFVSISAGAEDLHLEPLGNSAVNMGLDLSSSFTDDIDGQTRGWPWDIGADWQPITTFHRSIGTNAATVYSTGDVTVSIGSSTVTFAGGANLPSNVGAGDQLTIGAESLWIHSRDSTTQVTTQIPAVLNHTNSAYTISRAYNTMQAWETDRDGDLVGGDRIEVGVCYNDGAFTDRLVISGSTADSGHYMAITVAASQRHNGYKDTGAVIDAQAGWGNLHAISVEDEYTRIEWLEIKAIHDTGSGVYFAAAPAADNGVAHGIFVHSFWQNNNAGVDVAAQNVTVRNSFFTGGSSFGIRFLTNSTGAVENCTLYGSPGSGSGVVDQAGTTVSIKNTISLNHDAGWDFALYSGIAYFGSNMYSQTTGFDPNVYQGGNQLSPSTNLEYLFVDTTTDDFHLETSGHRAGNTGLDLSSDFTDDIDGVTRVDTWDMGADEGVAGIDPLPPRILSWTEIEP